MKKLNIKNKDKMYDNANTATLPEGHPVSVYYQEREIIIGLLEEITTVDVEAEFHNAIHVQIRPH